MARPLENGTNLRNIFHESDDELDIREQIEVTKPTDREWPIKEFNKESHNIDQ